MSSTEQKNVTHPFIRACKAHGSLAAIAANALVDFSLDTDRRPFSDLGPTGNLGLRLLAAPDPHHEARRLLPVLDGCPRFTRTSLLFLKLCSRSSVIAGNQGVMFMFNGLLRRSFGMHIAETFALRHANRHSARVCGYLATGSYMDGPRSTSNCEKLCRKGESLRLRQTAEAFSFLRASRSHYNHLGQLRRWGARARVETGIRCAYNRREKELEAYANIEPSAIDALEEPPVLSTKLIKCKHNSEFSCNIRYFAGHYYFEIYKPRDRRITESNRQELEREKERRKSRKGKKTSRNLADPPSGDIRELQYRYVPIQRERGRLTTYDSKKDRRVRPKGAGSSSTLVIMSMRDMDDLIYLLEAASATQLYFDRRLYDVRSAYHGRRLKSVQSELWTLYRNVVARCSRDFRYRNKLGVYFDVLQWRYLAHKSGNVYYDHSAIMGEKINSKDLVDFPSQDIVLDLLKQLPTDMAIDLLGIYKASIYPEVDPFKVVADQYKLHMSRFQTEWEPDTPERLRFDETRAYMWFFGIRIINNRFHIWPGKIREGVETKPWHTKYKSHGIPGNAWRDAHDIDLTDSVPVADISNEQYMRQQDSACAPPLASEFQSFKAMREAPRHHKKKVLYTIQEPNPPDLPDVIRLLNSVGRELPDDYVGKVDIQLPFSTDISTGSRCERHKDAPRPFYAASSPWGCILSYFDGITRDFLSHVPQSMLGKSTRQKFSDLQSASRESITDMYTFFMSDDKAKYSPRMDPHSQQLPGDFFAEVFNIPALKAYGPIMYHCELYYRVDGHLVHYNSNGTDREGMRGSANTWLEIVAQGLSTRLCREKGLIKGKSMFLSFIDDGLRKFSIDTQNRTPEQCEEATRDVIEDVIFGLRVLGRELSWDKSFISRELYVMLNEINYRKTFMSSGLKSFCTIGDIELKELMTASDYEQLYFGKMRGAHSVGAPLDICHYAYVYEVLVSHFKMGLDLQDKPSLSHLDYRLFCMTPIALGGAGIRSQLQMGSNEVATATKEGMGNLLRLGCDLPPLMICVESIFALDLEPISPLDFMREPEQFHVPAPRIKTQRMTVEVRHRLTSIANNEIAKKHIELDRLGQEVLNEMGKIMMAVGKVNAEEVRLLYASTPVAFVDNFIQKLVASSTISHIVGRDTVFRLRKTVRADLINSMAIFPYRCNSRPVIDQMKGALSRVTAFVDFVMR